MSFAEGGGDGVFAGINAAARKGNLARMSAQVLPADGQDHAWARAIGHRDENRGRHALAGSNSIMSPGRRSISRRLERTAKPVRERHCPDANGKNSPLLQTPAARRSARASSASS